MERTGRLKSGRVSADLAGLAAFLALSSMVLVGWILWERDQSDARLRELSSVADQISARLQDALDFRFNSLEILSKTWTTSGGLTEDQFRERSLDLQDAITGFVALNWLNEEAVATWVVPLESNQAVVGVDLSQHPVAGALIETARETRETTVTPWIDLIQGGAGVASYTPVIENGRVTGFLNGVFDVDYLARNVMGLHRLEGYAASLSTETKDLFVSPDVERMSIVVPRTIHLPGRAWTLKVHGEVQRATARAALAVGILAAFAIGLLVRSIRRHDTAMDEARARYAQIVAAMSDWIWETDKNGTIIYVSESAPDFGPNSPYVGLTRKEIAGDNYDPEVWRPYDEALRDGKPISRFVYNPTVVDGDTRSIELNGHPVFDEDGTLTGFRGTAADVTERVRLEQELEHHRTLLSAIIDKAPWSSP